MLMKWPVFGMLLEMYGIIRLFGSYFPMIFTMLHQVCLFLVVVDSILGAGSGQPPRPHSLYQGFCVFSCSPCSQVS